MSVDSCNGSPRSSSLELPLLPGTGFSVFLLTLSTESCDEDDGEVGEGVVEEELAMVLTKFPQGKNCGSFFKKHNFDD